MKALAESGCLVSEPCLQFSDVSLVSSLAVGYVYSCVFKEF